MGSPSRNVQYHPPRLSEDRLNLPQPHSPSLPTHCTAPGNRECAPPPDPLPGLAAALRGLTHEAARFPQLIIIYDQISDRRRGRGFATGIHLNEALEWSERPGPPQSAGTKSTGRAHRANRSRNTGCSRDSGSNSATGSRHHHENRPLCQRQPLHRIPVSCMRGSGTAGWVTPFPRHGSKTPRECPGGPGGRAGGDRPKRPGAVIRLGWLPERGAWALSWALSPRKTSRKESSASKSL